jgi:uncharacterized protein (DUF58 family)
MKNLGILGLLAASVYFESGTLFYAFVVLLVVMIGVRLGLRGAAARLLVTRVMEPRLFFGERTVVRIIARNRGAFSIPWLEIRDSVPVALRIADRSQLVVSVGAGGQEELSYELVGRQRGLYGVGPLALSLGDVFGIARRDLMFTHPHYILVYPRILALHELELPAVALFGDLRSRRPILGDPARASGVRDYRSGDPLHDIHWRATAATGTLQVKLFDPATTVQTMIYLDADRSGYLDENPFLAIELAISIAATVAHRLAGTRQAVGLATNGRLVPAPAWTGAGQGDLVETRVSPVQEAQAGADPAGVTPHPLLPAKGQAQLTHILELLARLDIAADLPLLRDLPGRHMPLPWGSTLVVITGFVDDALLVVHVHGVWTDAAYLDVPA